MNFVENIKGGAGVFRKISWRVVNRTAATVAVGDLVSFDITAGETETAAGQGPGGATGLPVNEAMWLNVITPALQTAGSGLLTTVYAIVIDLGDGAGADNTDIEVAVQGVVTAAVQGTNFTRGLPLIASGTSANRNLILLADAAGNRALGMIMTPADGSSAETTTTILFYGWGALMGDGLT